jgi:hypothetical protein
MSRYKVIISSMTLRYELGYYYAESKEDAIRQAWAKHHSSFRDCSISMLSAIQEN